jgi:hypothetical protein
VLDDLLVMEKRTKLPVSVETILLVIGKKSIVDKEALLLLVSMDCP